MPPFTDDIRSTGGSISSDAVMEEGQKRKLLKGPLVPINQCAMIHKTTSYSQPVSTKGELVFEKKPDRKAAKGELLLGIGSIIMVLELFRY